MGSGGGQGQLGYLGLLLRGVAAHPDREASAAGSVVISLKTLLPVAFGDRLGVRLRFRRGHLDRVLAGLVGLGWPKKLGVVIGVGRGRRRA